jgi:hypothetical protein
MTWKEDIGGKISRKMASSQITEEKRYAINAFLWKNFCYIFFPFFMSGISD